MDKIKKIIYILFIIIFSLFYYNAFATTTLLMHCDGTNGSTTIIDSSPSNHTITPYDNARISTTKSKFGGGSCFFDGTSDYMNIGTPGTDYNFGTGNFTIDFWINLNQKDLLKRICGDLNDAGSDYSWLIYIDSGNIIRFVSIYTGSLIATTALDTNEWNHIAVFRNGNNFTLTVNGINEDTNVIGSTAVQNLVGAMSVGRNGLFTGNYVNAYIDEFRVLKGESYWTNSFTPPTSAYGSTTLSFNVSQYNYTGNLLTTTTQESGVNGVYVDSTGTRLYIIGILQDKIFQYSLSTPFDPSTATYTTKNISTSSQDGLMRDLYFKSDGTKVYTTGNGNDRIYQYNLSTEWDITTAVFSNSILVGNGEGTPYGVFINPSGTNAYIVGATTDTVYQYTLTTPFDISTGSYASKSKLIQPQENNPQGLSFNNNGTYMFILGPTSDVIHQYYLSTAWDVSTATYQNINKSVNPPEPFSTGLFLSLDEQNFYITSGIKVYQFSLPSEPPANTCTYSGSGDWIITDNCTLTTNTNLENNAIILNSNNIIVNIQAEIIAKSIALIHGSKITIENLKNLILKH